MFATRYDNAASLGDVWCTSYNAYYFHRCSQVMHSWMMRCVAEYGLYHVGLPRETMISNSDIRFACGTCERCGFYTAWQDLVFRALHCDDENDDDDVCMRPWGRKKKKKSSQGGEIDQLTDRIRMNGRCIRYVESIRPSLLRTMLLCTS